MVSTWFWPCPTDGWGPVRQILGKFGCGTEAYITLEFPGLHYLIIKIHQNNNAAQRLLAYHHLQ